MPPIAARSAERVGTRSRSPGTTVRWPPYTMGTCAKSTQRRQSQKACDPSRNRHRRLRRRRPKRSLRNLPIIVYIFGNHPIPCDHYPIDHDTRQLDGTCSPLHDPESDRDSDRVGRAPFPAGLSSSAPSRYGFNFRQYASIVSREMSSSFGPTRV